MATKKKSKGVLEKIGDALASGAEAVVDAGSAAIHSVGEMMPAGKPTPKKTRAVAKHKAPKAAASKADSKVSKPATATAKASKPTPKKSAAPKVEAKSAAVPAAKSSRAATSAKKKAAASKA